MEREYDKAVADLSRLREAERWIPVGERLPEDAGEYLILLDDGDVWVGTMGYIGRKLKWMLLDADKVTHWRPLPAGPEEGDKNDG
jgi:hypothetical protein